VRTANRLLSAPRDRRGSGHHPLAVLRRGSSGIEHVAEGKSAAVWKLVVAAQIGLQWRRRPVPQRRFGLGRIARPWSCTPCWRIDFRGVTSFRERSDAGIWQPA